MYNPSPVTMKTRNGSHQHCLYFEYKIVKSDRPDFDTRKKNNVNNVRQLFQTMRIGDSFEVYILLFSTSGWGEHHPQQNQNAKLAISVTFCKMSIIYISRKCSANYAERLNVQTYKKIDFVVCRRRNMFIYPRVIYRGNSSEFSPLQTLLY